MKPKLRNIEIIQVQGDNGDPLFLVRDQFHITDKMVICPANKYILLLLNFMDGEKTIRDIQTEFVRSTGELIYTDIIEQLCNELSKAYLLDDENFAEYLQKITTEFNESPIRKSSHAGFSYPAEPEEIIKLLNSYFEIVRSEQSHDEEKTYKSIKAIISPHIDFNRGGKSFAYAYNELKKTEPADIYIILGIAHAGGNEKFIGTYKDFETPLGIVKTDKELLKKISENYSGNLFSGEFTHKNEHSIEFQLIFLQYLFGGKHDYKIIPILCSSFHDAILDDKSPMEISEIKSLVESVKNIIKSSEKKICIISGSDLAHVGKNFGDMESMTTEYLTCLELEDKQMLRYVEELNAEDFYNNIKKDKDRRKVCGFPSIYTTLKILEGEANGKLLKYEKAVDKGSDSCVSFASLVFY